LPSAIALVAAVARAIAIAVTIAIAVDALQSSAGGRRHTSAILFVPIFLLFDS
jgi:hypothetical protein